MTPKVSILIPCYNAEKWIAKAIQSALNQTYKNIEIIVVDDGSTDRSLEIIKGFGDEITWRTGPNYGGNIARNRLLELSSGEWLQYLDADDYLLPSKVEKQINLTSHFPDVDVVWSPGLIEYYSDSGSLIESGPIHEEKDLWILLAKWQLPQTGRSLWRKKALLDVGCWKPSQPCCQEHELYMRLLMAGKKFMYLGESDSVYRLWDESTVSKKDPLKTIRFRLEIEDQIERHLEAKGELNKARQDAINQARFECARVIWNFDQKWAIKVMSKVNKRSPKFKPSGQSIPKVYSFFYSLFGFSISEKIAEFKRRLIVRNS